MAKTDCKPLPQFSEKRITRFWSEMDQSGGEDACWLWKKGTTILGYGQLSIGKRKVFAHRLAYFLGHGIDPGKLFVCHRCDTPGCCNPRHLFAASQKENLRDCLSKGRFSAGDDHFSRKHPELVSYGERNGGAKLTEADVIEIRKLYATGLYAQHEIGAMFGVNQVSIGRIVRREIWKHVNQP